MGRSSRAVSILTATMVKALPPTRPCSRSSAGISSRQGTHHVAHRLRSTVSPFKADSSTGPSSPEKMSAGIGLGVVSIARAAISPLARGASFRASSVEAAQSPVAAAASLLPPPFIPYRTNHKAAATIKAAKMTGGRMSRRAMARICAGSTGGNVSCSSSIFFEPRLAERV